MKAGYISSFTSTNTGKVERIVYVAKEKNKYLLSVHIPKLFGRHHANLILSWILSNAKASFTIQSPFFLCLRSSVHNKDTVSWALRNMKF